MPSGVYAFLLARAGFNGFGLSITFTLSASSSSLPWSSSTLAVAAASVAASSFSSTSFVRWLLFSSFVLVVCYMMR